MPLRSLDEPGWAELKTDNVFFWMAASGGARIRCTITPGALLAVAGSRRFELDRLEVFKQHRTIIEKLASAKFDRGVIDAKDRTIYVVERDVRNW